MSERIEYSAQEIYGFAREAGFSPDQAATMTAIALAESSGRSWARNDRGEDSRGLWQINVKAHKHLEDADLYDGRANAEAAYEVSKGGTDISPWTVTHGDSGASYLHHREAAEAAAEAHGDGAGLGYWGGVSGYGDHTSAGEPEQGGTDTDPDDLDPGVEAEGDNEALQAFLQSALAQTGDSYDFGAEVDLDDSDPDEFDCSELVEWAAAQAGVDLPNWTVGQYRHLAKEDALMSVEEALETPGALLFRFSEDPLTGNPQSRHVAISLGDGRTIEARGQAYGVGSWDADDRGFTYAAYVPAFGNEPLAEQPTDVEEPEPEDSRPGPIESAADASIDDLRQLEELYNTAAQQLHDQSVDAIEGKGSPELIDALYEQGGLKAQLEAIPGNRAHYEERRDHNQEKANRLSEEVTRLEQEGRTGEAEERLEEALQADAYARLNQQRIDLLEKREAELTERVEQLEQQITERTAEEDLDNVRIEELENDADAFDDARRALEEAIAARQDAETARAEAEQAEAEGDTARTAQLEQRAQQALQRSRQLVAQAGESVPDTDEARQAFTDAEELNRATDVLVGDDAVADAELAKPETSDEELLELAKVYDRAAEALHFESLEELQEAGQIQVSEQNVRYDRAQGLGAELEHVRSQLAGTKQVTEAWASKAARLREESASLEQQGDHRQAEEKQEEADRVDVLLGIAERSVERWSTRETQLAETHQEAVDEAAAARAKALEHVDKESALEATADLIDDAKRILDQAIEVRTEAWRLDIDARKARAAGDAERYQELSRQSVERVARSDELVREAREMVSDSEAAQEALDSARQADPGEIIEIHDEGEDTDGPGDTDTLGDNIEWDTGWDGTDDAADGVAESPETEPALVDGPGPAPGHDDELSRALADADRLQEELTVPDGAAQPEPVPDPEPEPLPEPDPMPPPVEPDTAGPDPTGDDIDPAGT